MMERITSTDDVRIGDILMASVGMQKIEETGDGWYVWLPNDGMALHAYHKLPAYTNFYSAILRESRVEFMLVAVHINIDDWGVIPGFADCYTRAFRFTEEYTVFMYKLQEGSIELYRLTHNELIDRVGKDRVYTC